MDIFLDNVSVLNYGHKPKYFGGNSASALYYGVERSISIKGKVADYTNTNGVSGVVSGMSSLIRNISSPQNIYINNEFLGSGYISNINVENGNWVRGADYTADITSYQTGNLSLSTGSFYSGINWQNLSEKIFASRDFKEDYQWGFENYREPYISHSVSFDFDVGAVTSNEIALAKQIFGIMHGAMIPFGLDDTFGRIEAEGSRAEYSESYDQINGSFAFTEKKYYLRSGDNSWYGYYGSVSEVGVTTITEEYTYKSRSLERMNYIRGGMSIYGSGSSAVSAIRSRCVDYASAAGLSTGLNATPFRKDLNLNFFNGTAISRTSFSDDPYQNERYSHETSSSASISDDGHYVSVEMALSVLGYGNKNTEENYQNAKYGYSIESPYVSEASASDIFYQIIAGLRCSGVIPKDLQKKSESKSFSKYGGKISHTISYSNKLWDTDESGNYIIDYNGSSKSLYKQNYQLVNLCGQTKKVYFPVEPIYSQTTTYKTTVGGNAIIATEYVPFPLPEFSNLRDYVIDQSCSVSVSKKSKTLSSEITELI